MSSSSRYTRAMTRLPRRSEVDVWWTDVSAASAATPALSEGERIRAQQLHESARGDYVRRHTFVREVLAVYARTSSADVVFGYGAAGQPILLSDPRWQFSMSRSGPLAVCAVTTGRVGVDVEASDSIGEADALAQLVCTSAERNELAAIPLRDRGEAFLRLWTAKEAYLKADGIGLRCYPALV